MSVDSGNGARFTASPAPPGPLSQMMQELSGGLGGHYVQARGGNLGALDPQGSVGGQQRIGTGSTEFLHGVFGAGQGDDEQRDPHIDYAASRRQSGGLGAVGSVPADLLNPTFLQAIQRAPGPLLLLAENPAYLDVTSENVALKSRIAELEGELRGSQLTAQQIMSAQTTRTASPPALSPESDLAAVQRALPRFTPDNIDSVVLGKEIEAAHALDPTRPSLYDLYWTQDGLFKELEVIRSSKKSGDASEPSDNIALARGRAAMANGENKRCYYLVDKYKNPISIGMLNEIYNFTYSIWEGWITVGIAPDTPTDINRSPLILEDFCARLRAAWPAYYALCANNWKAKHQVTFRYGTFLKGESSLCRARRQRLQVARARRTGEIGLDLRNALYRLDDEETNAPDRPSKRAKRESTDESVPLSSEPQNELEQLALNGENISALSQVQDQPRAAPLSGNSASNPTPSVNPGASQPHDGRGQGAGPGAALSRPGLQSSDSGDTSPERTQPAENPPPIVPSSVASQSTSSRTMDDLFAAARPSNRPARSERPTVESNPQQPTPTPPAPKVKVSDAQPVKAKAERRWVPGRQDNIECVLGRHWIKDVPGEPDVKKTRERFLTWRSDVLCKENKKADKELFDKVKYDDDIWKEKHPDEAQPACVDGGSAGGA
ncbi:hypothetical protein PENSPDRAFT_753989 [Peniophora sp. CONT]|nr:hypothetical protein PENSPDRAFT_753989 [Peniophora sp. CONT]